MFGALFKQSTFDIGLPVQAYWRSPFSSVPYFDTLSDPCSLFTQKRNPSTPSIPSAHKMAAPKRYTAAISIEYHTRRYYLVDDNIVRRSIKLGTLCRLGEKLEGHLSRIAWLDEQHPLEEVDREQMECIVTRGSVPVGMSREEAISHVEDYIESWMQYRTAVDSDSPHQSQHHYKKLPEQARKTKTRKLLEAMNDEMAITLERGDNEESVKEVTEEEWDVITVQEAQAERGTLQRFSSFD